MEAENQVQQTMVAKAVMVDMQYKQQVRVVEVLQD
jgi:hypothetical protein